MYLLLVVLVLLEEHESAYVLACWIMLWWCLEAIAKSILMLVNRVREDARRQVAKEMK